MESSFDAVLDDPAIDALVIATPAERHYAMARAALLAGKDVFVEKPLTLHCHEAEILSSLAERQARILMVGHLLEFHPAVTRLQELIEAGELGRLEYIYSIAPRMQAFPRMRQDSAEAENRWRGRLARLKSPGGKPTVFKHEQRASAARTARSVEVARAW
jgi:predicted dehydrogenase